MSTSRIYPTDFLGIGADQKSKPSGEEGDFIVHHLVNKLTAHAVMSLSFISQLSMKIYLSSLIIFEQRYGFS
jgi:hypothetical protein